MSEKGKDMFAREFGPVLDAFPARRTGCRAEPEEGDDTAGMPRSACAEREAFRVR